LFLLHAAHHGRISLPLHIWKGAGIAKGIVSSGYSNDPIMAHYRNFGFQAAIAKPYKFYDLIECINNVLLK